MSQRRGAKGGAKGGAKAGTKFTGRGLTATVKTAKGRKASSTRWLQRQLNDPYVEEAKRRGYRSRAAFKLTELDDRFHFLGPNKRVVDLGAAPGGWAQVAVERCPGGQVVGIDLKEIEPVAGAELIVGDFLEPGADDTLKALLGGPADVVLSDMAASSTGHAATDHLKIMALLEAAADFAAEVLAEDGAFVGKVLQGGAETELLAALKRDFRSVRHAKPPASRSDSAETYVVALGFRGRNDADG